MASDIKDKPHVSVAFVGHIDSGKSTAIGHLMYQCGAMPAREHKRLTDEAQRLGKGSFAFAFYCDRTGAERERGITIRATTRQLRTQTKELSVIDCPGHGDFLRNALKAASDADVAVLMAPADGSAPYALQKGDTKTGEREGWSRSHARLMYLLGMKQLIVCINKMDDRVADYKEERFLEVAKDTRKMLIEVGWPKAVVESCVPFIPLSAWTGDNLVKGSGKMAWWKGCDVKTSPEQKKTVHVATLLDAFDNFIVAPERNVNKPFRMPVSNVYMIKGIGWVITGRVLQGSVKNGDDIAFLPKDYSHQYFQQVPEMLQQMLSGVLPRGVTGIIIAYALDSDNPCRGKVFSVEQHHEMLPAARAGSQVGICVKGIDRKRLPETGDVAVSLGDRTLAPCRSFVVQAKVAWCSNEIKVGYQALAVVRRGEALCQLVSIDWRIGKDTNGEKKEKPAGIKQGDMVQCRFEALRPLVVEPYAACEPLGRVAFVDGRRAVLIGKIMEVEYGAADDPRLRAIKLKVERKRAARIARNAAAAKKAQNPAPAPAVSA